MAMYVVHFMSHSENNFINMWLSSKMNLISNNSKLRYNLMYFLQTLLKIQFQSQLLKIFKKLKLKVYFFNLLFPVIWPNLNLQNCTYFCLSTEKSMILKSAPLEVEPGAQQKHRFSMTPFLEMSRQIMSRTPLNSSRNNSQKRSQMQLHSRMFHKVFVY